jgi:acyl carrier protein
MATKTAAAAIDAICAWRKEAVLPDEAAIYAGMAEISSDVFERDDLRLSAPTSAQDIEGWDSLRQIMILVSVEERFGIKFTTREMDSMRCIGDLVRLIATKVDH